MLPTHLVEIVPPSKRLLLPRQNPRRVNQRHRFQKLRVAHGALYTKPPQTQPQTQPISLNVSPNVSLNVSLNVPPNVSLDVRLNVANFSASVVRIQDPDLEFVEEIDAEFGERSVGGVGGHHQRVARDHLRSEYNMTRCQIF